VEPLILVTGFGAFAGHGEYPTIASNPSRALASRLVGRPPRGVRITALELPVSFRGAPRFLAERLGELAHDSPRLLLGLGVQSLGGGFRLERHALGVLAGDRPDAEGVTASELAAGGAIDRATRLALEPLAASVRVSLDAGQYVCECAYNALLALAAERSIDALFVHVPPEDELAVDAQEPYLRALVDELARGLSGR
jgi:pyrrolidone-carboxylate peptidase